MRCSPPSPRSGTSSRARTSTSSRRSRGSSRRTRPGGTSSRPCSTRPRRPFGSSRSLIAPDHAERGRERLWAQLGHGGAARRTSGCPRRRCGAASTPGTHTSEGRRPSSRGSRPGESTGVRRTGLCSSGWRLRRIHVSREAPLVDRRWRPATLGSAMSDRNPELSVQYRGGGYPLPPVPARPRTCRCGRGCAGRGRRPADLRRRGRSNEPPRRRSSPIRSRVSSPRRGCTPTTPRASTTAAAEHRGDARTTPACVGVGECGLDYFRMHSPARTIRTARLRPHIDLVARGRASRSSSTSATRGPTSFECSMRVRPSAW